MTTCDNCEIDISNHKRHFCSECPSDVFCSKKCIEEHVTAAHSCSIATTTSITSIDDDFNETETTIVNVPRRRCEYPTCENLIPETNEFRMCESCRTISISNSIRLLQDPFSPFMERQAEVFSGCITRMTGDEALNWQRKMEWSYQELCKVVKLYGLTSERKRAILSPEEEQALLRSKPQKVHSAAEKVAKKRKRIKESRQQKLEKLLGNEAKRIMGEMGDVETNQLKKELEDL